MLIVLVSLVAGLGPASGQVQRHSISPVPAITDNPWQGSPDFFPQLLKLEAPTPGSGSVRAMLADIKAQRSETYRLPLGALVTGRIGT